MGETSDHLRRRLMALAAILAIAGSLVGCGITGEWQPAGDRLRNAGFDRKVHITGTMDIESEQLSGQFRVVLAANRGPKPRVRLQLYPDVGGKILDLSVSSDRMVGFTTDGSLTIDVAAHQIAPRDFMTFLALTILDMNTTLSGRKDIQIRRASASSTGYQMQYEGVWPRLAIFRTSNTTRHTFRNVSWDMSQDPSVDGAPPVFRLDAPGISIVIRVDEESLEDGHLPESTFELELPENLAASA